MIADLEKEGYDAREIGTERATTAWQLGGGGMRPFPQSADVGKRFVFRAFAL
jgi:hypothetical protein